MKICIANWAIPLNPPSKGDDKVPSKKRGGLAHGFNMLDRGVFKNSNKFKLTQNSRTATTSPFERPVLSEAEGARGETLIFLKGSKKSPLACPDSFGERGGLRVFLRGGRGVCVGFLLLFLLPLWSVAQQPDTTRSQIYHYLHQAAQNNPELKAQYQQYLAALEQVPQVNTLPDPELSFGYFISPTETRVGPQQARVGLTQMFPWFGTLGARGDVATQKAKATFEAFQERRNTLFFKIKKTWYELYHVDQSIQITRENIDILETFESLTLKRYETAQASQADILRVQIDKEDLKTRAALLQDTKNALQQRLAELVNRPESLTPQIPDTLAVQNLPGSVSELKQRTLQQNPRLTKLDYEAASARGSIEVAQKEGLPKFGLGADYIITGEGPLAPSDNGKDAIVARVGIQIPLYRKKYRAQKKQAHLRLQAVQNRQEATQNSLLTTFEETLRNFYDAQRRVSLYKNIQIQRTRQALDILTEEYATSATDFEELLRLQRKLLEFQLAREEAIVGQNTAVAHIEYLYGKYNVNPESVESRR